MKEASALHVPATGLTPIGVDLTPAERASVGPLLGKRWRFLARPGAPGSADFSLKFTPFELAPVVY